LASEVSTIQSLKAVDAWIDVINANINGGVRTAFKSSRLKFSGSNTDVQRTGNANSLPLQFPEPGLTTANTVIDWSQGAITASTEVTHLAIQGDGFFMVMSPDAIDMTGVGAFVADTQYSAGAKLYLTRDGEFRTNQYGFLVNSAGYYLVLPQFDAAGVPTYSQTVNTAAMSAIQPVYNDIELGLVGVPPGSTGKKLSEFITGACSTHLSVGGTWIPAMPSLVHVTGGQDLLQFSTLGSTIYDFGFTVGTGGGASTIRPGIRLTTNTGTIQSKALEASNASMTQSVPELSLAQKLFSALTKVLQTKQTNVDGVLNLVR
jgi:flagellar hook protein FlgE